MNKSKFEFWACLFGLMGAIFFEFLLVKLLIWIVPASWWAAIGWVALGIGTVGTIWVVAWVCLAFFAGIMQALGRIVSDRERKKDIIGR